MATSSSVVNHVFVGLIMYDLFYYFYCVLLLTFWAMTWSLIELGHHIILRATHKWVRHHTFNQKLNTLNFCVFSFISCSTITLLFNVGTLTHIDTSQHISLNCETLRVHETIPWISLTFSKVKPNFDTTVEARGGASLG